MRGCNIRKPDLALKRVVDLCIMLDPNLSMKRLIYGLEGKWLIEQITTIN